MSVDHKATGTVDINISLKLLTDQPGTNRLEQIEGNRAGHGGETSFTGQHFTSHVEVFTFQRSPSRLPSAQWRASTGPHPPPLVDCFDPGSGVGSGCFPAGPIGHRNSQSEEHRGCFIECCNIHLLLDGYRVHAPVLRTTRPVGPILQGLETSGNVVLQLPQSRPSYEGC